MSITAPPAGSDPFVGEKAMWRLLIAALVVALFAVPADPAPAVKDRKADEPPGPNPPGRHRDG